MNYTIEEISQRAESLYPDNPEYWAVYTAAARDQQKIDKDAILNLLEKWEQNYMRHLNNGNAKIIEQYLGKFYAVADVRDSIKELFEEG